MIVRISGTSGRIERVTGGADLERVNLGVYDIIFTPPFSQVLIPHVTVLSRDAEVFRRRIASIDRIGNDRVRVVTVNPTTNSPVNAAFIFTAFKP